MAKKTQAQIEFKAVTSEFSSGIKEMNSSLKTMQNELKLNSAQLKGNADDVDLLQQKQNILQREYEASTLKIEYTEKALQEAARLLGENSKEYQDLYNALLRAGTQQQAIQNEINQTNQKLQSLKEASNDANRELEQLGNDVNSFNKLNSEIEKQQQELNKLKQEYSSVVLEQGQSSSEAQQLASKINALSNDLKENQNKLKQASDAANEFDNTLNDLSDSAEESSNALENAFAFEGLDTLTDAFSGITDSVKEFGIESQTSLNQVQAQLGLTNSEMSDFEDIIHQIYADNFGESLADIGENMAYVHQITGQTGEALKVTTENAYLLSDVYGIEIQDSVKGADALMKQFGISSDEAYNLLSQGCENGLNKNDDLLDIINEYSPMFAQAGYSAEDMFNALSNGAETGAFSVDSLGDAFKEMNIRILDSSADDYLKKLGFNADEFRKKYAKGGESAKQVTQEMIQKLAQVSDKQERNNIGVGIFGTMWEDNGEKAILALGDTNGAIDQTRDKLSEMNEVRYDDLNSALEGTKRILLEGIKPVVDPVVEGLTRLAEGFANLPAPIQTAISIILALGVGLTGLVTILGMVSSVAGIFSAGLGVLSSTFGLIKVGAIAVGGAIGAISTPVLVVIGVVTGLIAIGVALYKNWDTVKAKASQAWNGVGKTINNVTNGVKSTVTNGFNSAKNTVNSVCNGISSTVSSKFNSVKNTINNTINNAKNTVKSGLDKIKGFFSGCKLSFPKIKLPHFSISGSFSINPPKAPSFSVKWYKTGAIMNGATIFGMNGNTLLGGGEAGHEAILPLDGFYNYLDNKLANLDNNNVASEIRLLRKQVSELELSLNIDGKEFVREVVAPNQNELDDYNNTRNPKLAY